ncbi:hypothetical protein MOO46_03255 [Apilactobacillus apisilvae]|uniref:Lysozyme n=1 Tax=Apilactobacillus apisilvae TaxID=2923364 RepID=A0ABY4PIL2_9LACO|nr:GH25 family lysozyme [Apilactobacillus apisilvae]UQS85589.1 hypothetical protein MOO46_03255 [Apilactobacillus apisilvae]
MLTYISINIYHNQTKNNYAVKGVLVSQYDGYIDFVSLANDNQKFVYIRASQGSTYTDDNFYDNFSRSQGSGMQIGAYHVFSTQSNIKSQLTNFTNEVGSNYGSIPPLIMANNNLTNKQINSLSKFLYLVHHYYNSDIVVNTSENIFNKLLKNGKSYLSLFSLNKLSSSSFISISNNSSMNIDGSNVSLNQVAFNGNKKSWEHYLMKTRDQ